jgi:hypothetical protein
MHECNNSRKHHLLIAAALICLVLFVTQNGLFRQLWFDEAVTVTNFMFLPSIADIYHAYIIPNNHIVYTILLKLWFKLYSPEIAFDLFLRLLSLLLAVITVILIYTRWRKRFGTGAAVLSAVCLIVCPAFAVYAVAIRGYMLAFLLIVISIELAKNWTAERRWMCLSGYFLVCWLAVGVMPTSIIALGAVALLCVPLPFSRRGLLYWLPLALIPPAAALLFYLPILQRLLAASALKEGWNNPYAAMFTLYSAAFIAVLPLLLPVVWLLPRLLRRNYGYAQIFLVVVIIALPIPFFLSRIPAPFPRVFIPLLPVWLFLLCRGVMHTTALLRLKRNRFTAKPWRIAVISLLLGWGIVQTSSAEWLSAKIVEGQALDDYFSPYYVRASYNPADTIKKLQQLSNSTAPGNTYLSFMADPYPLCLYGNLAGIAEKTWYFDNPRGKVASEQQLDWAIFWSSNTDSETAQFTAKFPQYKLSLAAECGYHNIYQVSRK